MNSLGCQSHYDPNEKAQAFENVTTVPNWRDPSCDGWTNPIAPEPIPILDGDTAEPEECNAVNQSALPPARVTNAFSPVSPETIIDYGTCLKRGFKQVWARKAWHGRRGFLEPCGAAGPFGQTKYLKIERSLTYTDPGYQCSDGTPVDDPQFKSIVSEVNRYTGELEIECADNMICEYALGLFSLDHCGSDPHQGFFGAAPGGGLYIDWNDVANGIEDPGAYTLETSVTDTEIHITVFHSTVGTPRIELLITLSLPYTAAEVHADAMALLGETLPGGATGWNLSNDLQCPWRTDVPIRNTSPAAHWEKQIGPSYGPLVTYNERGPVSPDGWGCDDESSTPRDDVILGAPNPAGYAAHWDSNHQNMEFIDASFPDGNYCWVPKSYGAFSPFANATQWTPDNWDNQFVNGAVAQYNSPLFSAHGCSMVHDPSLEAGSLVVSKYAEIYLFEFPGHNYDRPCGDDALTVDPDLVACPSEPLRWPAATECPDPGVVKRGDYSIKYWFYRPLKKAAAPALSELDTMEILKTAEDVCGTFEFTPCKPVAVFFQESEPTGKYLGSRWIGTSSIALRDEVVGAREMGECKIWQLDQVMIDPLFKPPRFPCDDPDSPGELDPDACVLYEENRDCLNGECVDYVAHQDNGEPQVAACEPAARYAWDHEICVDQL